jgi:carbon-monoxide dehydrogenase iron sulfur subunit
VSAIGRLVIDPGRCRGCRSCQLACSFGKSGEYNPSNSCIDLERDLRTEETAPLIRTLCCDLCEGHPACADACTYGAITYETASEFAIQYRREQRAESD